MNEGIKRALLITGYYIVKKHGFQAFHIRKDPIIVLTQICFWGPNARNASVKKTSFFYRERVPILDIANLGREVVVIRTGGAGR